ncbi:MAG: ABC transporter permease [Acidimicrobiales bacterium]
MANGAGEDGEAFVVYEPATHSVPPLGQYFRSVWERREFVWELSVSKLTAANFNTALGQFWNLLTPVLLAICYLLLLRVLRDGDRGSSDHVAALLSGLFFFFYTRNCLQEGAKSLLAGEKFLLNSALPRMTLPLSAVLVAFLQFVPTFVVYLFVHRFVLQRSFGVGFTYLPIMLVILTVFNIGLTLTMAVLTVYVRDTSTAMPIMTRLWIYLTPVLFLVEDIPPHLKPIFYANPIFPLFASLQDVVGGDRPDPKALFAAGAWATVAFTIGVLLFVTRERDFAVRL